MVELAAWVAGPAAGGILADWGADVVKVEPPAGDPQRRIFGALGIDVAVGAALRARQPGQALGGARPADGRGRRGDAPPAGHGRRLRDEPAARRPRAPRPRPRRPARRATRGSSTPASPATASTVPTATGRLRRRRVLGPLVDGPVVRAARRAAAGHPQRARRSRDGHDDGGRDQRRAAQAGAHRPGWPGGHVAAADGHVLHGVGHRHPPALRPAPEHPPPRPASRRRWSTATAPATAGASGSSVSSRTVTGRDCWPRWTAPTSVPIPAT